MKSGRKRHVKAFSALFGWVVQSITQHFAIFQGLTKQHRWALHVVDRILVRSKIARAASFCKTHSTDQHF